ncbi:hypothetical protein B0H12DRAFT_1077737 [Mycena haematopus]|nr:hypothetical protein B0H12DRAFT_1077737 [Mycena haematopus]
MSCPSLRRSIQEYFRNPQTDERVRTFLGEGKEKGKEEMGKWRDMHRCTVTTSAQSLRLGASPNWGGGWKQAPYLYEEGGLMGQDTREDGGVVASKKPPTKRILRHIAQARLIVDDGLDERRQEQDVGGKLVGGGVRSPVMEQGAEVRLTQLEKKRVRDRGKRTTVRREREGQRGGDERNGEGRRKAKGGSWKALGRWNIVEDVCRVCGKTQQTVPGHRSNRRLQTEWMVAAKRKEERTHKCRKYSNCSANIDPSPNSVFLVQAIQRWVDFEMSKPRRMPRRALVGGKAEYRVFGHWQVGDWIGSNLTCLTFKRVFVSLEWPESVLSREEGRDSDRKDGRWRW